MKHYDISKEKLNIKRMYALLVLRSKFDQAHICASRREGVKTEIKYVCVCVCVETHVIGYIYISVHVQQSIINKRQGDDISRRNCIQDMSSCKVLPLNMTFLQ